MNRLKKILLLFVLPFFCLLISVSNAVTSEEALNVFKSSDLIPSSYWSSPNIKYFGFTYTVKSTGKTYQYICFLDTSYPLDPSSSSNTLTVFDKITSQEAFNSSTWYINSKTDTITLYPPFTNYTSSSLPYKGYYYSTSDNIVIDNGFALMNSNMSTPRYSLSTSSNIINSSFNLFNESVRLVENIKDCTTWDGESYYYETSSTPDEPDTPSLPSNADITKAVQAFYNTIYNRPNIAFDDFFVLYDKSTGLYSYIGHTRGNAIGQVIVEPNGYYNGYMFDKQWWQFFLDEQNDSWEWQNITKYNKYYLYSSQGDIDTLKLVGQDKIDNLFTAGPWATSNTVIVYSTNDYPVKYITFSDESPDPVVEEGTIKGDQYTYDENLDITDNQYNPLENFVSVDYPSSLVSRAEFDKFMETFDENKDFLILPVDSNWIVIACNSLFNHFSSFIIMCAVFIIVERIMRG